MSTERNNIPVPKNGAAPLVMLIMLLLSVPVNAEDLVRELQSARQGFAPSLSPSQVYVVKQGGTTATPVNPIGAVIAEYPSCVCTNLANVSVICEDCDKETQVDYCYTHDRACQDAALRGGIREHDSFFCTTLAE